MPSAGRLLLVDDEAIIVADLEERLNQMGYEVVGMCGTGAEAVALATTRKPDLVIMDIVMPGELDGIAAAVRIRRESGIPSVFLTAYADQALIARAKDAHPLGYIVKPFQENQLYSTLEVALYNSRIERRMRESEARYRAVIEDQSDLVCRFSPDLTLSFCNRAFREFFSTHLVDSIRIRISRLFPDSDADLFNTAVGSLSLLRPLQTLQVRTEPSIDDVRHLHWAVAAIFDVRGQITEYQAVGRDITDRVIAEEEVRRLNRELEWRVQERTWDLEAKTRRLEETNVALEVLLKRRETDRLEFERNILHNVRELVEPTLQQLKLAASESTRTAYLEILETHVQEIVSPFSRKLSDRYASLTAQEIQVANLVKQGKTAKETAELMGLSIRTIDAYRANIRKKLGLTKRCTPLQAYLKSLD